MNQLGVGAGDEDVVRLFFRTQVLRLDRLLELVFQTFQAAIQAAGQGADLSEWILEANRIFIVGYFPFHVLTLRRLYGARRRCATRTRPCTRWTGNGRR